MKNTMDNDVISVPAKRLRRYKIATCFLAAMFVLSLCAIPVAFVIGLILGESQVYHRTASEQEGRMAEFFAEHPERFGSLIIEEQSSGFASPFGDVRTQEDYDFLSENLNRMFGDELGKLMIKYSVSVAEE